MMNSVLHYMLFLPHPRHHQKESKKSSILDNKFFTFHPDSARKAIFANIFEREVREIFSEIFLIRLIKFQNKDYKRNVHLHK